MIMKKIISSFLIIFAVLFVCGIEAKALVPYAIGVQGIIKPVPETNAQIFFEIPEIVRGGAMWTSGGYVNSGMPAEIKIGSDGFFNVTLQTASNIQGSGYNYGNFYPEDFNKQLSVNIYVQKFGGTKVLVGTQRIYSAPYAIYADRARFAENIASGMYVKVSGDTMTGLLNLDNQNGYSQEGLIVKRSYANNTAAAALITTNSTMTNSNALTVGHSGMVQGGSGAAILVNTQNVNGINVAAGKNGVVVSSFGTSGGGAGVLINNQASGTGGVYVNNFSAGALVKSPGMVVNAGSGSITIFNPGTGGSGSGTRAIDIAAPISSNDWYGIYSTAAKHYFGGYVEANNKSTNPAIKGISDSIGYGGQFESKGVGVSAAGKTYAGQFTATSSDTNATGVYGYGTSSAPYGEGTGGYFYGTTYGIYASGPKNVFSGRVGIGAIPNTASYLLDISGGRLRIKGTATDSSGIAFVDVASGSDRAFVGMAAESKVGFWGWNGCGWGMVMNTTNGNVGIGVGNTSTSPVKLEVFTADDDAIKARTTKAGYSGVSSFHEGPYSGTKSRVYSSYSTVSLNGTNNGHAYYGKNKSQVWYTAMFINEAPSVSYTGTANNQGGTPVYNQTDPAPGVGVKGKVVATGGVTTASPDEDIAEWTKVSDPSIGPGDVLVIDPKEKRMMMKSDAAYSDKVVGIVSTQPAFIAGYYLGEGKDPLSLTPADMIEAGYRMLALAGQVPCNVSTENGPIEIGDLLTTSSTPGYAMKVTDKVKAVGAIVGKALEPLATGKAKIMVLTTH